MSSNNQIVRTTRIRIDNSLNVSHDARYAEADGCSLQCCRRTVESAALETRF